MRGCLLIHRRHRISREIQRLLWHYGAMVFEVPSRPATEVDHVISEQEYEVVYFGGLFERVYHVISARLIDADVDHLFTIGTDSQPDQFGNIPKTTSGRNLRRFADYGKYHFEGLGVYFKRRPGNLHRSMVRRGVWGALINRFFARRTIRRLGLPERFTPEIQET